MIKWKSREIVEVEEDILMTMTTKWKNYNENRISSKEICGENKLTIWRPIANTTKHNSSHVLWLYLAPVNLVSPPHIVFPGPRVQHFYAIIRMVMG